MNYLFGTPGGNASIPTGTALNVLLTMHRNDTYNKTNLMHPLFNLLKN
jgi:hypothetical protein